MHTYSSVYMLYIFQWLCNDIVIDIDIAPFALKAVSFPPWNHRHRPGERRLRAPIHCLQIQPRQHENKHWRLLPFCVLMIISGTESMTSQLPDLLMNIQKWSKTVHFYNHIDLCWLAHLIAVLKPAHGEHFQTDNVVAMKCLKSWLPGHCTRYMHFIDFSAAWVVLCCTEFDRLTMFCCDWQGYVPMVLDVEVDKVQTMDSGQIDAIRALWNDGGVQICYERRREYQLSDSAK